jgi:hypothetical protein
VPLLVSKASQYEFTLVPAGRSNSSFQELIAESPALIVYLPSQPVPQSETFV